MRLSLRCLPLVLLACLTAGRAYAGQPGDCRQGALSELRAAAPDGYAVYQRIKDKAFFFNWIDCEDVPLGLSTAVHESVHAITADSDEFPLVGGGDIQRPHEVSTFFAPALIAGRFKDSDFAKTYLRRGKSSSATDFLYLLDELNAYSHDLKAAVDLKGARPSAEEVDHRDGLAALMAFVGLYVETAQESQPDTWSGLQTPNVARTVAAIWTRAEGVMASSCGIPDFGAEDKVFIRRFCDAGVQASLGTILGRAPVCPTACLAPTPDAAQDDAPAVEATGHPERQATPRPFWSRGVNRRVSRLVTGQATTTP